MTQFLTFTAGNLADTQRLGRFLAESLPGGSAVALIGTLGAGKTALVQAVAEAGGVEPGTVSSPTFVLVHEYNGEKPVYHFDAYRLESETEFLRLGPDDYFEGTGLTFVEWADKFPNVLPKEHIEIRIEILGETQRRFSFTFLGEKYAAVKKELEKISYKSGICNEVKYPD